jgi:uncharacterized protein (DUF1778 family)
MTAPPAPATRTAVKRRAQPRSKARAAASKGDAPLSLRVDSETRSIIDRAASALGQTRTEFMLSSARERAIEVLLDQRLFVLNDASWATFVESLDNPPSANAKLKALLARVPIWDRR